MQQLDSWRVCQNLIIKNYQLIWFKLKPNFDEFELFKYCQTIIQMVKNH